MAPAETWIFHPRERAWSLYGQETIHLVNTTNTDLHCEAELAIGGPYLYRAAQVSLAIHTPCMAPTIMLLYYSDSQLVRSCQVGLEHPLDIY